MWVHSSASIIECHVNPLTNSTHSEEGPEYSTYRSRLIQLPDSSQVFVRLRDMAGPRTDEVLTVRDGLPRSCGVAKAKNDADNYSCSFALTDMHSCG